MFNIVLIEPEIPNNTGNIGRLCLASGCKLHLVQPFGFEISDSRLKRAGLDYWQHLKVEIHGSQKAFFQRYKDQAMAFLSSHGKATYLDIPFKKESFLIFGKESTGLDKELLAKESEQSYYIPLHSDKIRSLNLANAVGIVIYEGLRQLA
ncbi:MAG: tRNA (cytidine(34)-2'-O)-methyltransferase [Bacteroidota bacterium]